MEGSRRVQIEGGVELELPPGWVAEADEEEGTNVVAEDGVGLLNLVLFEQGQVEPADPAEELYAFLEDQGIELEEDEVDDVELTGEGLLALCEYITENEESQPGDGGDPDEEAATFWLVGVATGPGALLFGSYSCPAGEEEKERELVREILSSLRLPVGG